MEEMQPQPEVLPGLSCGGLLILAPLGSSKYPQLILEPGKCSLKSLLPPPVTHTQTWKEKGEISGHTELAHGPVHLAFQ